MIQSTSIPTYEKLKRGDLRLNLLHLYATKENLTDKEAEKLTGIHASTISGLRRPLMKLEWVDEGEKRQCLTTGNKVIAWKITSKGLDYLNSLGGLHPQPVRETSNQLF